MAGDKFSFSNWNDLTPAQMTSLFLYGTLTPPQNFEERLRSSAEKDNLSNAPIVVEFDAVDFMANGPGRYAHASQSEFVDAFFTGGIVLPPGTYTRDDLIASHGYLKSEFSFSAPQSLLDPSSPDYSIRTYIYNQAPFIISNNTQHDRQSAEGAHLTALREIRVTAEPYWDADKVEVHFRFIKWADPKDTPSDWPTWIKNWVDDFDQNGRFKIASKFVCELRDMNAEEYLASAKLDLDRMSKV